MTRGNAGAAEMDVSDVVATYWVISFWGGGQSFCTVVSHLLKLQQRGTELSFPTTAGLWLIVGLSFAAIPTSEKHWLPVTI